MDDDLTPVYSIDLRDQRRVSTDDMPERNEIHITVRITLRWWFRFVMVYVCVTLDWLYMRTLATHISCWAIKHGLKIEDT